MRALLGRSSLCWLVGAALGTGCAVLRAPERGSTLTTRRAAHPEAAGFAAGAPDTAAALVVCLVDAAGEGGGRALDSATVRVDHVPVPVAWAGGCGRLRLAPGSVALRVGRLGYRAAAGEVVVRRGYIDTVRVELAYGATPSREACRAARRAGQGCL